MKFAVLADVHGNRWGLEAVLEDLERRHLREVINLGDCLYGPLDPAGTLALLDRYEWPTVRGNQDRVLLEPSPRPANLTYDFVVESIGAAGIDWLREETREPFSWNDAFLCHGTPERDDQYLLEEVARHAVHVRLPADLDANIQVTEASLVLCGHSHIPRVVTTSGGVTIVNPGSVGLPAYVHDVPHPHAMESGSSHARFAVIERTDRGWRIEQIAVAYDHEAAARAALRNGRADWHAWIGTGRSRSDAR